MNTLRNKLKQQYSQIPNELITDLSLSNGALRVLLYLFTKPDEWNIYNKDIQKQLNISDKTLAKYWKELLASRWLRRTKRPPSDGKFAGGYLYQIGNFSISEESSEKEKSSEHSNNKPINKKLTSFSADEAVSMWNEFASTNNKSKVMKLTGKRKKKLQERIKELKDYETALKITLEKASNSSFCLEGKWFSFDWLIENDTNLVKVFEGKYDNEKVEYR